MAVVSESQWPWLCSRLCSNNSGLLQQQQQSRFGSGGNFKGQQQLNEYWKVLEIIGSIRVYLESRVAKKHFQYISIMINEVNRYSIHDALLAAAFSNS